MVKYAPHQPYPSPTPTHLLSLLEEGGHGPATMARPLEHELVRSPKRGHAHRVVLPFLLVVLVVVDGWWWVVVVGGGRWWWLVVVMVLPLVLVAMVLLVCVCWCVCWCVFHCIALHYTCISPS